MYYTLEEIKKLADIYCKDCIYSCELCVLQDFINELPYLKFKDEN